MSISTGNGIEPYLASLYGVREPAAWIRLMNIVIPFSDDDIQAGARQDWQRFIKAERKKAIDLDLLGACFTDWWNFALRLLQKVGLDTLTALSPDYESQSRLRDVIKETKARIEELLTVEPDLPKALARFSDDQTVRILTIHKSKGLEFDSVIILGVENQTFWGKADEERCAFFVGVSRAKRRLVMTVSARRDTPPSNPYRWRESRTPHGEFLGYAQPFLSIQI
jgi:superfamily I DNA/RNA helicase